MREMALPAETPSHLYLQQVCMRREKFEVLPEEHMVCRFIFAFGGAGLFTFLTAVTGLAGVGWNSRWLLGTYSVLLVIMLLVQAAVAITLFADDSWRKYLPPDRTGEFHKVLKRLPVLFLQPPCSAL